MREIVMAQEMAEEKEKSVLRVLFDVKFVFLSRIGERAEVRPPSPTHGPFVISFLLFLSIMNIIGS